MPAPLPTSKPTPTKHPLKNKRAFQLALVRWFDKNAKSYPWRKTTDPWAILVSEIMLQQTQVKTVLDNGHYTRFMLRYPTPQHMAEASEQEVLKTWEGLGYYRRAKNLHAAARAITRDHLGSFPTDYEQIRALPGIGPYTAGAVASFAYNAPRPIVDANVARVFSRLFNFQDRIDTSAGNKQLWQWAEALLSRKAPRSYNSALMELGQTHCSNQSPDCPSCPVNAFCHATSPAELPIKKSTAKITRTSEFALFVQDSHSRILLHQLPQGARREGMWTLPRRDHSATLDYPLALQTTYSITRYHVTLRIYAAHPDTITPTPEEKWHPLSHIENLPMPSPDRRALETLLSH